MKLIHCSLALATVALLGAPLLSCAEDAKPPGGGRPGRAGGPGGLGGPGRETPEERVKMMKEHLGLTDDQAAKIKAILEKNHAGNQEKLKAIREDQSLSREDKGKKMREIMEATMEEIKPILTPEQQTKWKEEMEKRRTEMEKRRAAGGAGAPDAAPK